MGHKRRQKRDRKLRQKVELSVRKQTPSHGRSQLHKDKKKASKGGYQKHKGEV
jgi:hypothetical protein